MSVFRRLGAYLANPDPRTAACNTIALVVAWNQPLYPFWVLWLVGGDAWTACWTFLSTPFFGAVPLVARRHSLGGRLLLVAAGIGNTMLSTRAFGAASAVEWFLLPCALIAAMAFRRHEVRVALPIVATLFAAAALLHGHYGAPFGRFSPGDDRRFASLNGWSVATLCLFIAWTLGRAAYRNRAVTR